MTPSAISGRAWLVLLSCLAASACQDEFENDTLVKVAVDSSAVWTRSMMVRDTDTLVVKVVSTAGDLATGIGVQWTSSNPVRLELRPLVPTSNSPQDVLAAQLGVQAIAHARGSVTVTARVDQPGVDTASFSDTVTILERWIAVSAGGAYTCGLTVDQDAFCWGGLRSNGPAIGNGSIAGSDVPVAVLGSLKFSAIAAGSNHTCGITLPAGLLYCWGGNESGQLGDGNFDLELAPQPGIGGFNFTQVSAQDGITCGISVFTTLIVQANTFCWGRASAGSLGIGALPSLGEEPTSIVPCFFEIGPQRVCIPKFFAVVTTDNVGDFFLRSISVGGEFVCGIATLVNGSPVAGDAYCWGANSELQLGTSLATDLCTYPTSTFTCSLTPIKVASDLTFTAVSAGGEHACAAATDAGVYCWGKGYGAPTVVPGSETLPFDSVTVGSNLRRSEVHTCALSAGQAYCWGDGTLGELGNDQLVHHDDLQRVLQDSLSFVAISAGGNFPFAITDHAHTCALTRDGAIYCWGANETGALGNPSVASSAVPVRIAEPSP